MNICALGYHSYFEHDNINEISFSSNETILEYDVLFLDLSNLFDSYYSTNRIDYEEYRGLPRLDEANSLQIKKDISKRKNELEDFLKSGKTVFVFNSNDHCVVRDSGKSKTIGSGTRAKTVAVLDAVHSINYLPIDVQPTSFSGSSIDIRNSALKDGFKKFMPYLNYYCTYNDIDCPLMTIHSTNKCISYYSEYYSGMILFVPDLYFPDEQDGSEPDIEDDYYNFLCSLPSLLRKSDADLPEYSYDYYLPNEKKCCVEIEKLEKEIETKSRKLVKNKSSLVELQSNKILFTGTGTPLEINVKDMLEDIGFNILYYDPDGVRKDIEIGYKDKVAVVEVKGVSGSATESHVAQTVKWKMEYFVDNEIMPKGLLIVNAFNNRRLEDRQEYFPAQIFKFSKSQEIGLLTTIQLFNIKCYLKKNPDKKDEIIESIFNCICCYDGFNDWKENIEQKNNIN